MPAPLVKTRHPGIYKRGSRYTVTYRVNGKQHKEATRTLEEALRLKRSREAARDAGGFEAVEEARMKFRAFAEEWIERYQGNGRRGFTDDTRADYKRDLERYAFPFFDGQLGRTVATMRPRDVANWIAWLCDGKTQGEFAEKVRRKKQADRDGLPVSAVKAKPIEPLVLADATVRRIVAPVRACLSTARREGLIPHNPVDGAVLPHRPQVNDEDSQKVKVMSRAELGMFLELVHPDWRLFFELLAASGLRWGEIAGLRWLDVEPDGSYPRIRVRRALQRARKGKPVSYGPPKSKYGVRAVPIKAELARGLRSHRKGAADEDLVFPSRSGSPLRHENVRRRALRPVAEEAGVPWIGFHTFRHTCASLLFAEGRNAVQVQRWLGHHSPAFTLERYVHLLDDGVGEALSVPTKAPKGGNRVATEGVVSQRNEPEPVLAGTAS